MAKRFREGSLDLEIPETEIQCDAAGNPVDVVRSERLFSHRLIEELMLAANVAVATFLSRSGIPSIYRIHEPPNPQAVELLQKYIVSFGGKKISGGKLQRSLTRVLQEFAGKPEANVLHILTLRSMSQAKYSPENLGHFGLGFEFYSHFTSPIRRYPDLIVHRLLKSRIVPNEGYKAMSEDELTTAGNMLSACEQRAVKAERLFKAIKKARFMKAHVGKEFDGVISSVAKFGIFVMLREFDIDGLVHVENLGPEKLEFDEEKLRLVARRSGMSYSIGDEVSIRVAEADIVAGQVDFELARSAKAKAGIRKSDETRSSSRARRGSSREVGNGRAARDSRDSRDSRDGPAARSTRKSRGARRADKRDKQRREREAPARAPASAPPEAARAPEALSFSTKSRNFLKKAAGMFSKGKPKGAPAVERPAAATPAAASTKKTADKAPEGRLTYKKLMADRILDDALDSAPVQRMAFGKKPKEEKNKPGRGKFAKAGKKSRGNDRNDRKDRNDRNDRGERGERGEDKENDSGDRSNRKTNRQNAKKRGSSSGHRRGLR
jgi:ribonuclease R